MTEEQTPTPTIETRYMTSDVANMLKVSPGTVRRWAKMFHDVLGAGMDLPHREFSPQDVETLKRLREVRKPGMSPAEVIRAMRNAEAHPDKRPAEIEASFPCPLG